MDALLPFITEPLAHPFMQRALLVALLIGSVCAIFSCFLVLRGWSLMGDAVSHAVLPGIAAAHVIGIPLSAGAFGAGVFCAWFTNWLKHNSRVKEDTVMGIVFSGMFALGLVMLSRIETDLHLMHILFGNILGTSAQDVVEVAIIAGVCIAVMLLKRRDLMLVCFDPDHARVIGLPVRALQTLLLLLLALTIVAALQAAGIILVIAMLIAPGAIGFLASKSFDRMLAVALTVSVTSCLLGTWLSYHLDAATAPLIVVIQAAVFAVVFLRAAR